MTGLVHGDPTALVGLVADVLGETDLDDHLRLDEVFDGQRPSPAAEGDDQCLVEQPLDANRAVAGGAIGDDDGVDRGSCDFLAR